MYTSAHVYAYVIELFTKDTQILETHQSSFSKIEERTKKKHNRLLLEAQTNVIIM